MPTMTKTKAAAAKAPSEPSTTFNFRCTHRDLRAFRDAAEREGFGMDNVAEWIRHHLRQIATTAAE